MSETASSDDVRGIVVGWDASDGAKVALDWAAGVALRQGLHLTVLHCLDVYWSPGLSAVDPAGSYAAGAAVVEPMPASAMLQPPQEILELGVAQAAALLGPDRVSGIDVHGTPAGQLVEASKVADFVVTGSRGRGRLLAGLLGSTSYAVTAHSRCPAIVVRTDDEGGAPRHPGPDARIVVGIDGSPESERALEHAADIAARADAPLHVVAVSDANSVGPQTYSDPPEKGRHDREAMGHAQDWLREAKAILGVTRPSLSVEYEVLSGPPGHALADLGVGAGLIVVGSRGRGGFAGLVLGSVSHTVIHEARCPVMVVH